MTNKNIAETIRRIGQQVGLTNDTQITAAANCYPGTLNDMCRVKTSPRLNTLQKFADALGVEIMDLITERSQADIEIRRMLRNLSEFEKAKVAGIMEQMIFEKNKEQQKAA